MSSEKTTKLGLHKWVPTDYVKREEFNENFAKIDDNAAQVAEQLAQTTQESLLIGSNVYGAVTKQLSMKTASVPINDTGDTGINNLAFFDMVFSRLKRQGIGAALIPFSNITESNGYVYTHHTKEKIQAIVDIAKSKNVPIQMLKPHIGMNYSDTINRANYLPTDISAHFTNWTQELLFYADICDTNGIEWLSISCEHYKLTTANHYFTYWQSLVNTIRDAFPNVKLTIACTSLEFEHSVAHVRENPNNKSVLSLVDALGANIYEMWHWNYYEEVNGVANITVKDVEKAFYSTLQGYSPYRRFVDAYDTFKKPILITEFGCMNNTGGLISLSTHRTQTTSYEVQAILFQAFFGTVMRLPFIIGFSIWNIYLPFKYFDFVDESVITAGEQVIIDYTTRGLI